MLRTASRSFSRLASFAFVRRISLEIPRTVGISRSSGRLTKAGISSTISVTDFSGTSGSCNFEEWITTNQESTFLLNVRAAVIFSFPSFERYVAWAIKPRGTYGMAEAKSLPAASLYGPVHKHTVQIEYLAQPSFCWFCPLWSWTNEGLLLRQRKKTEVD